MRASRLLCPGQAAGRATLCSPLGPVGQAVEKPARPLRDRPVLRGPGPALPRLRACRRPSRKCRPHGRRPPSPAPRPPPNAPLARRPSSQRWPLLAANSAALRAFAAAAMTLDHPGIHKARQRAPLALNRNRGMPDKAVAREPSSRKLVVSWIARTSRPATRDAVPAAARSTIFSTVTLSWRRNGPIRTSPARLPPRRRTERPRGPCRTRRSCKNPYDRSTRRSPKNAAAPTIPQPLLPIPKPHQRKESEPPPKRKPAHQYRSSARCVHAVARKRGRRQRQPHGRYPLPASVRGAETCRDVMECHDLDAYDAYAMVLSGMKPSFRAGAADRTLGFRHEPLPPRHDPVPFLSPPACRKRNPLPRVTRARARARYAPARFARLIAPARPRAGTGRRTHSRAWEPVGMSWNVMIWMRMVHMPWSFRA